MPHQRAQRFDLLFIANFHGHALSALAYQEIDEKIDVNRKSSGISGVWLTSTVCNH